MEAEKIKVELELAPEMALLVGMYLIGTIHGDYTLHKLLTEHGSNLLSGIAQEIIDQVAAKTDFEKLRFRNDLSRLKDEGLLSGLEDLLN